jgi:hypothetical protein
MQKDDNLWIIIFIVTLIFYVKIIDRETGPLKLVRPSVMNIKIIFKMDSCESID